MDAGTDGAVDSRGEGGYTLLEVVVVVALVALLGLGLGGMTLAGHPGEVEMTARRFDALLALARLDAQATRDGAALTVTTDRAGTHLRVLRGRPGTAAATTLDDHAPIVDSAVSVSADAAGAPFAIALRPDGTITVIPSYTTGGSNAEVPCPSAGLDVRFTAANAATAHRRLACVTGVDPVPDVVLTIPPNTAPVPTGNPCAGTMTAGSCVTATTGPAGDATCPPGYPFIIAATCYAPGPIVASPQDVTVTVGDAVGVTINVYQQYYFPPNGGGIETVNMSQLFGGVSGCETYATISTTSVTLDSNYNGSIVVAGVVPVTNCIISIQSADARAFSSVQVIVHVKAKIAATATPSVKLRCSPDSHGYCATEKAAQTASVGGQTCGSHSYELAGTYPYTLFYRDGSIVASYNRVVTNSQVDWTCYDGTNLQIIKSSAQWYSGTSTVSGPALPPGDPGPVPVTYY